MFHRSPGSPPIVLQRSSTSPRWIYNSPTTCNSFCWQRAENSAGSRTLVRVSWSPIKVMFELVDRLRILEPLILPIRNPPSRRLALNRKLQLSAESPRHNHDFLPSPTPLSSRFRSSSSTPDSGGIVSPACFKTYGMEGNVSRCAALYFIP